jgi:spore maturation protein CgeB
MYQRLQRAEVALNFHIDVAGGSANNLRLYETTGVGTLLITDWKTDLNELFEPGREVLTYRTVEECLDLILSCLRSAAERQRIAAAGQRRTMAQHTYATRARELIGILDRVG